MTRSAGSRRPVLIAAAISLVLAGCGQQSDSARVRVARYITRVNRVELALSGPLGVVTRVSAAISSRHAGLSEAEARVHAPQLAAALTQIAIERRRLTALATPAPAVHLRVLVLTLTSAEAALTRQLELLVSFLPRFAAEVAPVESALARLESALSVRSASGTSAVAAVYEAKARALRRFQATTQTIVTSLRALDPPSVSRPTYDAQLASLRGMGASAGRLAKALAGGAPGDVTPLLVDFDRAALATRAISAQKAQIAAVRAYDRQSRRLSVLAEAIARERSRLATTLHS